MGHAIGEQRSRSRIDEDGGEGPLVYLGPGRGFCGLGRMGSDSGTVFQSSL